jgi:hypothetical protein
MLYKNKPMKKIVILLLPLFLLSAIGLNSCTSCKNRQESKEQKRIELDESEDLRSKIEQSILALPTSADVIKMLTELEVGYINGISNSTANVNKYILNGEKALNLGIYGADLSYVTLYNMNQEVLDHLDVIGKLASELNISRLYDKNLYDNISNNFDNKDDLVDLLTNNFNETYSYLSNNDQLPLALMVVAGAWVEGMYITTHISASVFHVEGIARVLLEQKESFELFLEIAESHPDDPEIKKLLNSLQPIKEVYEGVDYTSLTVTNVDDITRVIEEVREKFTS